MIDLALDNITEKLLNSQVNNDLYDIKKEIATDAVNKIIQRDNLKLSNKKKDSLINTLIDNGTIVDNIGDFFRMIFGDHYTSELAEIREKINCNMSKWELQSLKESILQWIDNNASTTSSKDKTHNWTQVTWAMAAATTSTSNKRKSTWNKTSSKDSEIYEIDHFNITASEEHVKLYESIKWEEKPCLEAFSCAMVWYEELKWELKNPTYLTIVDFTKSKKTNRLFVINMDTMTVEYATKVWHGQWSWTWDYATDFSDKNGSHQSSLWFYRTPEEIRKAYTKSRSGLLLNWIEDSNDQARNRGIYMHPGWVNWSHWCFTLPKELASEIMNKLKWDSLLYAYAKSTEYFAQSQYFSPNTNWNLAA